MMIIKGAKSMQIFLGVALLLFLASRVSSSQDDIWQPPDGRSMSEWIQCGGMNCSQDTEVRRLLGEIELLALKHTAGKLRRNGEDVKIGARISLDNPTKIINTACVRYTPKQARALLHNMLVLEQRRKLGRRTKRKIEDFMEVPNTKWPNPINYRFDGRHRKLERDFIRNAIAHWQVETCIRFSEFPKHVWMEEEHLLFTNYPNGCWSFVGKSGLRTQPLNLGRQCLDEFGVVVHEIGHAIGLWHEHQRADRDQYIRVLFENIAFFYSQYYPSNDTVFHGVPYDLSSVMHYAPKEGSINGDFTLVALNPLYQRNMGQRTGLSFLDAKIVNMAYCRDACKYPFQRQCQRGGYQDPNNCSRCRCPDGFGGVFCESVAVSKDPCGGELMASYTPQYITSPGYPRAYTDRQECNWHIRAPSRHRINLSFVDKFAIYCKDQSSCFHWVEVKYRKDLGIPGPRFCCYRTPTVHVKSEADEMMVIFRSNFSTQWATVRGGFKATFVAVPLDEGDGNGGDPRRSQGTNSKQATPTINPRRGATRKDERTSTQTYQHTSTVTSSERTPRASTQTYPPVATQQTIATPTQTMFRSSTQRSPSVSTQRTLATPTQSKPRTSTQISSQRSTQATPITSTPNMQLVSTHNYPPTSTQTPKSTQRPTTTSTQSTRRASTQYNRRTTTHKYPPTSTQRPTTASTQSTRRASTQYNQPMSTHNYQTTSTLRPTTTSTQSTRRASTHNNYRTSTHKYTLTSAQRTTPTSTKSTRHASTQPNLRTSTPRPTTISKQNTRRVSTHNKRMSTQNYPITTTEIISRMSTQKLTEITSKIVPSMSSTMHRRTSTQNTTPPSSSISTKWPSLVSRPSASPPKKMTGGQWGPWENCKNHACKCGGFSTRRRYRMCATQKCPHVYQEERCTHICGPNDNFLYYAGKLYLRPCYTCANGYLQRGNKCIPLK